MAAVGEGRGDAIEIELHVERGRHTVRQRQAAAQLLRQLQDADAAVGAVGTAAMGGSALALDVDGGRRLEA
jgi:hypothetical protein